MRRRLVELLSLTALAAAVGLPALATGGPASGAERADRAAAAPAPEQVVAPRVRERAAEKVAAKKVVSNGHPYSDPVYYPVRQPMRMDCYRKNPGCNTHSKFQLGLVAPQTYSPKNRVFPMGAGKVTRIQKGPNCGHGGSATSFGTQIEISHGGGVTSRYGHLRTIARGIKKGSLVSLDTLIGIMGNTGARSCANNPYIDFYVKKNKKQYHFKNLRVCVNGTQEYWPRDEYQEYREWNDVPRYKTRKIEFPWTPNDIINGACHPKGVPATPGKGHKPSLRNSGKGKVTVSWKPWRTPTKTMIEVQVYRPSRKAWLLEANKQVGNAKHAFKFKGLPTGYKVRVRISFHNSVGYGLASRWTKIKTTAKR